MGKYLARNHGVRTERSEIHALWKYFPLPAISNLVNKYNNITNLERKLFQILTREAVRFCSRTVRLFPASLALLRMALIRVICKWLRKEHTRGCGGRGGGGCVRVSGHMIILITNIKDKRSYYINVYCFGNFFFTEGHVSGHYCKTGTTRETNQNASYNST